MKILKLQSENVKRLKAIEISPDGNVIMIGGPNDAGKSSVLDSIMYALGGSGTHPPSPVRNGEKKAKIQLDLGDGENIEYVVKKTITAKGGGELLVESANGTRNTSPQAILDALVGTISFDPSEFARMKGPKQAEMLKTLIGADFSSKDEERAKLYEERRVIGRQAKEAEAVAQGIELYPDLPSEPIDVTDLTAELEKRIAHNTSNDEIIRKADNAQDRLKTCKGEIGTRQERIEDCKQVLQDAEENMKKAKDALKESESLAKRSDESIAKLENADVDEIRMKIGEAKTVNEKISANLGHKEAAKRAEDLTGQVEELTDMMDKIDAEKLQAIEEAELPVEGLGFDEDGVTFGGVPFEQASQSERWKTSIAIGIAMNPKLRVMLIREGALLDNDRLKMVVEMAKEKDVQLWIEDVGDARSSVVIEDGAIKTQEA